ncbi:MAG: hypothetical protein V4587_07515 [Acidobacteriota bacterium]
MASEIETREREVSPGRLWFGFCAAGFAWLGLGIASVLITWRECIHEEAFGGASTHTGLHILNIVLFFVLLGIAVLAGVMSYRNWRRLAGEVKILHAEGTGSREYLALIGVFISITLGMGIIWLGIPLLILSLCVRIR